MDEFKFKLTDQARLICSGETGVIIGKSVTEGSTPQYLLRYKSNDHGQAVEKWWAEQAIEPVPEVTAESVSAG